VNATKKIKTIVKFFIPEFILKFREEYKMKQGARKLNEISDAQFANKSPAEVFTIIYENKLWGKDKPFDFYSGSGSHDDIYVNPYVTAVQALLKTLPHKPDVVDLGCGDFNIGTKLRRLGNRYIACDVVASLIERNKAAFKDLDVDFRCLDICADPLPPGEVVFIRQVLQHLSNRQILDVVKKLSAYKFLILTEGLPAKRNFAANEDKPIGDGVRFQRGSSSGVVLTLPPFNLAPASEAVICEIPCGEAVIRTIAYQLK